MIQVTITAAAIELISYKDKSGSPAQLRKQTGYAHVFLEDGTPSPFPDKFGFLLARDQAPWPAGTYTLHPSALAVDREGKLTCLPRLTPAKPAQR